MKSSLQILVFLGATLLLGGCLQTQKHVYRPLPPLHSFHSDVSGVQIRRVAVLPLASETPLESALGELDAAVAQELAKTSMFELVPISRTMLETRFGRSHFTSVEVLPGELLATLRIEFGVDGVLFTDLTHYHPYKPISIGVRSKLIDVQTGEVRWAFDHLFDAGNLATAKAAEGYYLASTPPPPIAKYGDPGLAVLQSPSRFTKYVAWEAFRSLLTPTVIIN